jgi:hypothetical protein
MVVLSCRQCQRTLPVAPEKIGRVLFVCPDCSFPLEAPDDRTETAPFLPLQLVSTLPATPLSPTPAPSKPPVPITPIPKPKAARLPSRKPAAPAPERRRLWPVGVVVVVWAALLAGILVVPRWMPDKEDKHETTSTGAGTLDLLDVLALADDLQSKDGAKRTRAALALGKSGKSARPARSALLEALKTDDEKFRGLVLDALDKLGAPETSDLPVISVALRDDDPDVRAYAVSVLDAVGKDGWAEIGRVRDLVGDSDPHVRAAAEATRGRMEKDMLEALASKLEDSNPAVRLEATRTLMSDLGPVARSAASSLIKSLGDDDPRCAWRRKRRWRGWAPI